MVFTRFGVGITHLGGGLMIEVLGCLAQSRRVSYLLQARKVFAIEIAALKAVQRQLDGAFERAVTVIVEALAVNVPATSTKITAIHL